MKIRTLLLLCTLIISVGSLSAQKKTYAEGYGHTLNLGLGIGYYGYIGHSVPVFHINYEFGVANNFTLAPFATFYTYHQYDYYYKETVIPLGVKGTYYFDQILGANTDWDFYLAGSLGFVIVKSTWDDGYYQDNNYHSVNPLFLDLHVGAEYHLSKKVGLFIDLSSGVSTLGLAFH